MSDINEGAGAAPEAAQPEAPAVVETDRTSEIEALRKEIAERDQTIGSLKREVKDLKKPKDDVPKQSKQSDGLDYGMKAFLLQQGLQTDEMDWFSEQLTTSGIKEPEALLQNGYFKSQLQARRDQQAAERAAPGNTRGTSENPRTSVDYWLQKGELPPNTPENTQLRRDVVNRRVDLEKRGSQFSSNPIVSQI